MNASCTCYGCFVFGQRSCTAFTCAVCAFESLTPLACVDDEISRHLCSECSDQELVAQRAA